MTFLVLMALISATIPAQPPRRAGRFTLREKTLVAWVRLANLTQRGGSVLTVESPLGAFDGIVFGEKVPGRWMAGSDYFRRTSDNQTDWPLETAAPDDLVQMAVVYTEKHVRIYRNGRPYAEHAVTGLVPYDESLQIVIGLRHLEAADRSCFVGSVEDARLYPEALDVETLQRLRPKTAGGPTPLGWWDFSTGHADDRTGRFPRGRLVGEARIEQGRLVLPGGLSCLVVNAPMPRTRETELWPRWHVSALPSEGIALPYDANGCIYWKGKYHLMYIFQDPKLPHGGHCWGHLSSTDLVNWTYHPPALIPAPGDPDKGIFSGNAFINQDGVPMLCWFGIDAGVCVATAQDDDLVVWKKHPKNPIVPIPTPGQPGHGIYRVWDPYLWYEGGKYWCLLGGNTLPNGKDTLYLHTSPDLLTWTPRHAFFEHADPSWTTEGEDCSCPDFFALGNRHALLCISHKVGARLYLGRFDREKEKFIPDKHVRLNWPGGHYFAPESLLDAKGRRIVWAWVTDPRRMATQRATGSGVQSLPRVLSLAEDGTLHVTPVEELQTLRRAVRAIAGQPLPAGAEVRLDASAGPSAEIDLEIATNDAPVVGVKLLCDDKSGEETVIRYEPAHKRLVLDLSRSTNRKDVKYSAGPLDAYGTTNVPHPRVEVPLALPAGEHLRLHVFVDGPVLEVFANDRQCVTAQVFPEGSAATGVRAFAEGSEARLVGGRCWKLAAAAFQDRRGR